MVFGSSRGRDYRGWTNFLGDSSSDDQYRWLVGVVIPNLLNWPDSVVVLDIKGENYDITAGFRAAHGQAVYAFSPFDEGARSLLSDKCRPLARGPGDHPQALDGVHQTT